MRKLAAAAGLAVALAATSAVAGPIEELDGYWSGGGTVVLSDGKEQVKCAVRYKVGQGGTQVRQTLRCASADYSINGTAEFSVRGRAGRWHLGGEDLLGHRPDIGPLYRQQPGPVESRAPIFTAAMTVGLSTCKQSITIQLRGLEVRRISMSLAKC
jgi:hypothetical protein